MIRLTFTIPGIPKGKARPKVSVHNGYAHAYTPKETVNYENYVKMMHIEQCNRNHIDGAVKADIIAYFPIPQSTSKKKRALMLARQIRHTKKIDCDNLAKVILDSLNGIAYRDDAQVCELHVFKVYDDNPRVTVVLTEIEE